MAFTKVVGAGIHTLSNIASHNINSSGIITATKFVGPIEGNITAVDGVFSGNVSIAKTLTYEDVKNVDSVGVGTFREGVFIPDNKKVLLGSSQDFQIYHDPNTNVIYGTAPISVQTDDTTSGISFVSTGGHETIAKFVKDGDCTLYRDNSPRIKTTAGGIEVSNNLGLNTGIGEAILINTAPTNTNDGSKISFARSNTVYAEIVTQKMDGSNNTDMYFKTGTSPTERLRIESDGKVLIGGGSSRSVGWENLVQIEGTNTSNLHSLSIVANRANAFGNDINFAKSRGSTLGSNTIVQDNDELGQIAFRGADGTDFNTLGAVIVARVDGSPASNNIPGSLEFYTGGYNKRLIINSAGHLMPSTDSAYNIGSSSVRYANIYADPLYGDGSNLTSLPAQATIANNANNRVITGGSGVNLNG